MQIETNNETFTAGSQLRMQMLLGKAFVWGADHSNSAENDDSNMCRSTLSR